MIGNDIVDLSHAHCAGVAKIIDLDRRRASRVDAAARTLGEAHEIDQDVDASLFEQFDDLRIRQAARLDKSVEGVRKRWRIGEASSGPIEIADTSKPDLSWCSKMSAIR